MRYIYALTKTNETGSDVTEYVSSSRALNQAELLILEEKLKDSAKNGHGSNPRDIIESGITAFTEATGRKLHASEDPVDKYITF